MVVHVADPTGPTGGSASRTPHDPLRLVAVVTLRDGAVATSGLAHRGAHVVDARTGLPPRHLASVTVVAASLTDADLDATTALALDDDGAAWLARRHRTAYLQWADGRTERCRDSP